MRWPPLLVMVMVRSIENISVRRREARTKQEHTRRAIPHDATRLFSENFSGRGRRPRPNARCCFIRVPWTLEKLCCFVSACLLPPYDAPSLDLSCRSFNTFESEESAVVSLDVPCAF